MDNLSRGKRIAKNSFLLYIRSIFVLLINLYTSRVVLNTLGVVDYGIYNVVGGVIIMLGFLTNSFSGASSRYITYGLGTGDIGQLKKTFGNILSIHLIAAIVIFVIAETVGWWLVSTKLQIPDNRQYAAFWVYQYSILASAVSLIRVPYYATVIAHERMSAFAYISIMEAVLKLAIVYLLLILPYDRLATYAFLILSLQLLELLIYGLYSIRNFEETKSYMAYDKIIFKDIFAFAGWTLSGNIAAMGFTQGLNILLNIFFGPVVNAARGIAVQVQTACQQFCSNFQMALNPQLTKSYAQGDLEYAHKLLIKSSKFSFYILFIIVLPIIIESSTILKLWLGTPPEPAVTFVRLMLIVALLFTLSNPIIILVQATGTIKKFQLIEAGILLMIVPIAYILLRIFHLPPATVFIVQIVMESCALYARLRIGLPMINMPFHTYIHLVAKPLIKVIILTVIPAVVIYCWLPQNLFSFFFICILCVALSILNMYWIGSSNDERVFLKNTLINILK